MRKLTLLALSFCCFTFLNAQVAQEYQLPPKEILDLVDIKPTPSVRINAKAEYIVFLERNAFKSLEELSAEEVRLAGLRINPRNNGSSRTTFFNGLSLQDFRTGKNIAVSGLPSNPRLSNFDFSPDEKYFSFLNTTITGIELWVLELASGKCTRITEGNLNGALGAAYSWKSDSKSLLVRMIPADRKQSLGIKPLPSGPTVQTADGTKAPVRTFQDLIKNKYDEDLFDYYAQSEIFNVDLLGNKSQVMPKAIYLGISESPDGNYYLVTTLQKPYSYIVQLDRFPRNYDVYDKSGKFLKTFYSKPLIENIPKGFDASETGKREIAWRADEAATLYWVEAQDGGDPANEVAQRDHMYQLRAPFETAPLFVMGTKNRFSYVLWGRADYAIVYDEFWKTRNQKTYIINPSKENRDPKILWDRSSEDAYTDPGSFHTSKNKMGTYTLHFAKDGKTLFLDGEGCAPEGNRPFFDAFDITTGKTKRLWRADGVNTYEQIMRIIDPEKRLLLTMIESPTVNPNFYLRIAGTKAAPRAITQFPHPYKSFMGVSKQRLKYKRKDGVELTGTLYLPAGYDKAKDGALPVVMWAYPVEYKDASQAGQVRESPHRFVQLYYGSPVYWAARGYAVLDDADFPIIGEGKAEPNDNFIPQLVANAEAAINTLAEMGVGDRKRVAVGGHSYGAFMTANLMAHCDLFAAGIARSGAYNRTLTPFGFQSEERTFWDAKNVYMEMSPFYHAEKINEPLLLIHGDADNNPGTFTLQSERLFAAIKGLGGTARLVLLPYESHGYAARENILHMLWEQDQWLEKYVKGKK
jgi:dipeptidyl aminopeptidase/acylaminoacyl peptidase